MDSFAILILIKYGFFCVEVEMWLLQLFGGSL
jgi:hypothetical protein